MLTHRNLPEGSSKSDQIKKAHLTCEYLSQPILTADFSESNFDGYLSDELKKILMQHQTLKSLILANNVIDQISILDLTEVLEANTCLTELDLTNNQIGSDGATYLLKAISENPNTALRKLNLSYNCIDSIEAETIKNFFKTNQSIETLILNQNALNTPSKNGHTLPLLFESLIDNQTLNYLSLQSINLIDKHIDMLIRGLNNNKSLKTVNLCHTVLYLGKQQIIHLLLSMNHKKNFTFIFGKISNELASLIVQSVPNHHLRIMAECPDTSLTKKMSVYQPPSIIQFSCMGTKTKENNISELHPLSVKSSNHFN